MPVGDYPYADEIRRARGVPEGGGRGAKITVDALSSQSGVGVDSIRQIEKGVTKRPRDHIAARLYEALDNATPETTPLLALAWARWHLDPDRAGVEEALSYLEMSGFADAREGVTPDDLAAAFAEADDQRAKKSAARSGKSRAASRAKGR